MLKWRVMYLFAGAEREADLGDALRDAAAALNEGGGFHYDIEVVNIDILRGGAAHDLLSRAMRDDILDRVRSRHFDLVLLAPPRSTFSRALFSDRSYPRPARDFEHPHGLPGLGPADKQNIEEADILVAFTAEAMDQASAAGCLTWLEFPEDLGECRHGTPASIWQFESFSRLRDSGLTRGAIYQCEWSDLDFKKPTGLFTNVTAMIQDPNFHAGWPVFAPHARSGAGRKYLGPLPDDCSHHGQHVKLIGKNEHDAFKTAASAAYPPGRCRRFATYLSFGGVGRRHSAVSRWCPLHALGPPDVGGRCAG